jgi:hypothetical protein
MHAQARKIPSVQEAKSSLERLFGSWGRFNISFGYLVYLELWGCGSHISCALSSTWIDMQLHKTQVYASGSDKWQASLFHVTTHSLNLDKALELRNILFPIWELEYSKGMKKCSYFIRIIVVDSLTFSHYKIEQISTRYFTLSSEKQRSYLNLQLDCPSFPAYTLFHSIGTMKYKTSKFNF